MRDGLCSRKGRRSMEIEKVYDVKEEGVYMKQLTAKDGGGGGGGSPESEIDNTQKPKQPKKQVRRRLHTSKPYQERLLNMAEARREIVTALKFHRASMKQQEASTTTTAATSATTAANHDRLLLLGQERKPKSRRILSLYPSTAAATTATSYWPISTTAPPLPSSYHDNLNLLLPSQTLGLNLNFQSFNNLDDTHFYHKPLSSSSSSTPSTSSSAPVAGKSKETVSNSSGSGLHHAMGDEEMEEIRSLGEKHQIEWNDTVNLVTSARWCNFLKTMEIEQEEGDEFYKIDQVMEFPPWLINANESSCLQDDHFSDATLPCMDIGEIEGMDGEWLA